MRLLPLCCAVLSLLSATLWSQGEADAPGVTFPPSDGPGGGRHIVLVAGDEEYRSEEALPMLARILARRHGFRCTVLFSTNPKTGEIDPRNQTNIPGLDNLLGADLAVLFLRFRELPDEQMKFIDSHLRAGKPVIGIRTATHAFAYNRNRKSAYASYDWRRKGGFGKRVLGETWVAHHGHHGHQSTRGVIEPTAADHPILRGVKDVWGPTDVYKIGALPKSAQVLLRGAVLSGMKPEDAPVDGELNAPMMPIVWTNAYEYRPGRSSRIVTSTIGAATDFANADLRRLFVNACYWSLGMEDEIRGDSAVETVGPYDPSPFGFGKYRRGVKPSDHALQERSGEFALEEGDRIALVGNALAERMQHAGWLEAFLQTRFPKLGISLRNLGFSGDELSVAQRTAGFGSQKEHLKRCGADVVFAFYGNNEAFAGREGLEDFEKELRAFVWRMLRTKSAKGKPLKLVLFSPVPFEEGADGGRTDAKARNAILQLYSKRMQRVAEDLGVAFVDLFEPMVLFQDVHEEALTLNGLHLNDLGNRLLGALADATLFGPRPETGNGVDFGVLRRIIKKKNLYWFNRYRTTDGYNVYGGRSSLEYDKVTNRVVLQRELEILAALADREDCWIHAFVRGEEKPETLPPLPEAIPVKTNKPGPGPEGEHHYLGGEEALAKMTPAEGLEVKLFADEAQFPELANPVQMAWDTRGRLWVAVWPSYPHWDPGQPLDDKLLILEDEDGDGRADRCKTFAGGLHNPTGFEFHDGGVIVANAPDLLFLEDTDGDDVCDRRTRILHGLSSADTHHSANSFVFGPDGALYFQEGIFHQSQVESIDGPVRNHGGCVWRFDPRTWRVERHVPYGFLNPHGHVFDAWGQEFVTDGTGNVNYFALPFSGHLDFPQRHGGYFPYFKQRSRPCAGTEILSSRHFGDAFEGNHLIANVIGFQGIFRYRIDDEGSGFGATELEPIVHSSDPNFRPSDIEVGPDGALYFLDWHNALIGHMQHHLRDPSRDKRHGRVYRVSAKGRPLSKPAVIHGAPESELVALLAHPEDRVRYRVRRELSGRESEKVLAAAKTWVAGLDAKDANHEHHLLEALWLHQQNDHLERELLERVLASPEPRARAAAVRVVRGLRHHLDDALDLLAKAARDAHPRVRLEALVAASFFRDHRAVGVALRAARGPRDRFLDYALRETLRALEGVWMNALREGHALPGVDDEGLALLIERVKPAELAALPSSAAVDRAVLLRPGIAIERRREAALSAAMRGERSLGAELVDALSALDTRGGGDAELVLRDLSALLQSALSTLEKGDVQRLRELRSSAQRSMTKAVALAGLLAREKQLEAAFEAACASREELKLFLDALAFIEDPEARKSAAPWLARLSLALPVELRLDESGGLQPGLAQRIYPKAPRNATPEGFAELESLEPRLVPAVAIDLPAGIRADDFGLVFEGEFRVAEAGDYGFFLRSDDGSRLEIDGRLVIDNDGDHGAREKSGTIRLASGAHALVVRYYDRGGSDSLRLQWQPPGAKRSKLPEGMFRARLADPLRAKAIALLAEVATDPELRLRQAAQLLAEGTQVKAALGLIGNESAAAWELRAKTVDAICAWLATLPAEQRSDALAVQAREVARALLAGGPEDEARRREALLADLGAVVVHLRTKPHEMRFDRKEFTVRAGHPVSLVFTNDCVMPHNLVITTPGSLRKVGETAEAEATDPAAARRGHVPELPEVLWAISLLRPGESQRLNFIAPEKPGNHPFVCTFPGHWRVMNGVMRVVEGPVKAEVAVKGPAAVTPARPFVKLWTWADLEPLVAAGWEQGRDVKRGRGLFVEAGCTKCHGFDSLGIESAPRLDDIAKKYDAKELLRNILEPSRSILEGYESWLIETDEGELLDGRILSETEKELRLGLSLQDPSLVRVLPKDTIVSRTKMSSSAMPTGLLVTLSREEILDLLAFLRRVPVEKK